MFTDIDIYDTILGGFVDDEEKKEKNVTKAKKDTNKEKECNFSDLKPVYTRSILSIYEYCKILTTLSKYLYSLNDVGKYIITNEYTGIINVTELAMRLIEEKKFGVQIDRGCEVVSLEYLDINPEWGSILKNHFKNKHISYVEELFKPLGLV